MNSQEQLPFSLPEMFVSEPSPALRFARLEFVRDHDMRGVVHTVEIDTNLLFDLKTNRTNGNVKENNGYSKDGRFSSEEEEEIMETVSADKRRSPAAKRKLNGPHPNVRRLHDRYDLAASALIGAIFFGYGAGVMIGSNTKSGIIGAAIAVFTCLFFIYLSRK